MGNSKGDRGMLKVDTSSVGYSDLRLWPCYLILTSLLLLLSPFLGLVLTFAVVCVPAIIIARFAAKQERKDIDKYHARIDGINNLFDEIAKRDQALQEYNAMPMVDLRSINKSPKETLAKSAHISKTQPLSHTV
jgi:hypothetical protein